jgi:hypothetical protein
MDEIFKYFVRGLFLIMIVYGFGMTAVILFANETIGLRMVSTFGSMFAGVLGLGSGYILGRSERKSNEKGKEDSHGRT